MQTPFLAKAQESLNSAQHLLSLNHHDSATSRAYYAVFQAARAALVAARVSAPDHFWSHEAIQGGFSQLTQRRKLYPAHLLGYLTLLHSARLVADYSPDSVSSKQAHRLVEKAVEFVSEIVKGVSP